MDPSLRSECHLMTSHDARGGRLDEWATACENVQGVHARPPAFVDAGNDVVGLGRSLPWTFPRVTSFGQVARTTPRSWTSRRSSRSREAAGTLVQARAATFDRWAKDLTCWSPSHPPSYGPSGGPIGLCPSSGGTYALAFFSSTPWTDAIGSFPSVGRRLGISHPIWHRCLPVHLIDRRLARERVKRRR